jgi:hypothetical protein
MAYLVQTDDRHYEKYRDLKEAVAAATSRATCLECGGPIGSMRATLEYTALPPSTDGYVKSFCFTCAPVAIERIRTSFVQEY